MKRMTLLLALAALLLLTSAALAQSGYDLSWWTADGGGATGGGATGGSAGGYQLGVTIGQPDAGARSGGGYTLGGGFWRGGEIVQAGGGAIYLPMVVR